MDTGTHLVIGLGLAGLAYVDPVVATNATVSTAVLIGTVLGSQAPDADGLTRFKDNASYIKNHRGLTHSLPAIAIWCLLITGTLALVFPGLPLLHVGMWVLIAICVHVLTDLFNAYGTQALRPLSDKWISWNIIHIFDPVIFLSHIIAIFIWLAQLASPAYTFTVLYSMLTVYYVLRIVMHVVAKRQLPGKDFNFKQGDRYLLIPTFYFYNWNVVKVNADGGFSLGELNGEKLQWIDEIKSVKHEAVEASKLHPDIAAFLYFSSYAAAELKQHPWGYEVRWVDVRYRHRKQYPFVAVLLMDREFHALDSYVGWLSDARLEKKLRLNSH